MTKATLHYYPGQHDPASRLASCLELEACPISVHTFPDGESLLRVEPRDGTAIVYTSLYQPNEKLIHVLQAAEALRANGSGRLVLVCPYLCYMRQDKAFHKGEAVSQQLVGKLLGEAFDRIITVDPHLHRVSTLEQVFPSCEADVLSATGLIADAVAADNNLPKALLVGPDGESYQWVAAAAQKCGADFLVATKERFGDRDVRISLPGVDDKVVGRSAIIIDDLVSSGATMKECARLLLEAGAVTVEAMAVHVVCGPADLESLKQAGVARLRSCDSVLHSTNAIPLAKLLAGALENELKV